MPRIQDDFLDCVVYLYPTAEDAAEGRSAGGTGFLVGVPFARVENRCFLHLVTNSHVVREGNSSVVRLNTQDGKIAILALKADAWVHHADADDVAVYLIGLPEQYNFRFIAQNMFLTKDLMAEHDFGPGDDVFFVGRFMTHEGKQRNLPTARFGNIAMMPWEPIRSERGIKQESFLVEARSLSGFSGSPVFVHIPPLVHRPGKKNLETKTYGPFLLGIDWGHLASFQPVLERDKKTPICEKWYVREHSGMMGVVPAWKLQEVLDLQELVSKRRELEDNWLAEQKKKSGEAIPDSPNAEGITKGELEETDR